MRALFYIIGGVLIAFIITIAVFWPTKHNYPSEVTQSFMWSCQLSNGGDQKLCADLLEEIIFTYSFEEYKKKMVPYVRLLSFQTNSNVMRYQMERDTRTIDNIKFFSLLVAYIGIILLIYLRLSKKTKK
tara:strand:+ start:1076 stop:1462 length:387 start_codon:yes stop_codon:yes gene_type:complete